MDPVAQPVPVEPHAVAAEAVGLENLRTRLQVGAVHFTDDLGPLQVHLVITDVDEHAAPVQLGADRAVEEVRTTVLDQRSEIGHGKYPP